jgi:hypothetical protein
MRSPWPLASSNIIFCVASTLLSQKARKRSSFQAANCSVFNFICGRNDLTQNESAAPQAMCNKIQKIQ